MGVPVVTGATFLCTMGTAPGQLIATSQATIRIAGRPAATIADAAPISNLGPCGMCTSMANPAVSSATAAALGVLTPMPCIPAPAGGWICSGTPLLSGQPMLTTDGSITCIYGGSISILNPAQTTTRV